MRQIQALDAIDESQRVFGYAPTLRELGVRLGIRSTNGVNDHLCALVRHGAIERDAARSRALRITAKGRAALAAWKEGPGYHG